MAPLATRFQIAQEGEAGIFKVVTLEEATSGRWPPHRCVILGPPARADTAMLASCAAGFLCPGDTSHVSTLGWWLTAPDRADVVGAGDIIQLVPGRSLVRVLWRRGANANSLFATGRCNSFCLMCSQPPTTDDDDGRLAELLQTVSLIDQEEPHLGITGGEPTLLKGLPMLIAACRDRLPRTHLHVLSNGRHFASEALVERFANLAHPNLLWAVPLYSDLPELHDWIVQAEGAFAETMQGLYHLALWRQRVEIRVVLHRPTVERLPDLAAYITRLMPFAEHVALMGLEPMGFARMHHGLLWIDPADYIEALTEACWHLANRGMAVSIYNIPLCVLPSELRTFARRSISDWKNSYTPECANCAVRSSCTGFFSSASKDWRSRAVRPLAAADVDAFRPQGIAA